jgi:DNA segregation ATPase FtsK/SpoIIIE, S-DNA-T family
MRAPGDDGAASAKVGHDVRRAADAPTMVVGGRHRPDRRPVGAGLFDGRTPPSRTRAGPAVRPGHRRPRRRPVAAAEGHPPATPGPVDPEQLHIDLGPAAASRRGGCPSPTPCTGPGLTPVDQKAVEDTGRVLEQALAEHGVETRLVGMVVGPTVTRYELELGPGVKVARVTSLHKDIAYAMASPDVRILAPIPGRQAIGVEVPNAKRELVALGDLLDTPEAKAAKHPLEVAVGRDINGSSVMLNLAQMPHVLIAGATGAGKSSCINSIITSMLMRATPDQVRMILVDPKRVELTQYSKLPTCSPRWSPTRRRRPTPSTGRCARWTAATSCSRRAGARHHRLQRRLRPRRPARGAGCRRAGPDGEPLEYQRLPFIVIVVDELNDLMMVAARDVEASICRIAQKARAVGIHLVLATQRPSVNVITGLIKANIPSRIAFAVSSLADSRVILDQAGAERLIGKGDMLMLSATSSMAQRVQGAWVTEEEVRDRRQGVAQAGTRDHLQRRGPGRERGGGARSHRRRWGWGGARRR